MKTRLNFLCSVFAASVLLLLTGCESQTVGEHLQHSQIVKPSVPFSEFKRMELMPIEHNYFGKLAKSTTKSFMWLDNSLASAARPKTQSPFWEQFQKDLILEMSYMFSECVLVSSTNAISFNSNSTLMVSLSFYESDKEILGCVVSYFDGRNGKSIAQCKYDCWINVPVMSATDFNINIYETAGSYLKRSLIDKIARYIGSNK